jgi:tetratricopeptide (TPR) repeat protein
VKRLGRCMVGMAMALSTPVAAQTPPAATLQQQFDAATKLDSDGNYEGALAAWQAIEQRPGTSHRTLALVRLRKGRTLFLLKRLEEAAEEARAGLAALPAGDKSLDEDRYLSWFAIAQIAESQLDYATAVDAYRKSVPFAVAPVATLASLRGLVTTETFTDSDSAMADMARLDALIAANRFDAKSVAIVRSAESRLLLNRGDFKAARAKAGEAVKLLGGLTAKTDLYDVAARSDYSIAALLLGDADDARQYMAMTGAGRLPKGEFDPGVQMEPPPCGGDADLKPADASVVQFAIRDDGTVADVAPIYAAGGGAAGLEFARAVRDWSWTPEQTKGLPAFFRFRARVEMRCSTAFAAPSISTHLAGRLAAWLADRNVEDGPELVGSDAVILPQLRSRLAAADSAKGTNALALVPLLHAIATNRVAPTDEAVAAARRGLALVEAADAPPLARLEFARLLWGSDHDSRSGWHAYVDQANRALGDAHFATSPEARAAIHLAIASATGRHDRAIARGALQAVADDSALDKTSPLRAAALMRLASLEARAGDVAAARTTFAQSGLDARQCALIDSPPQLLHAAAGGAFPMEAMRWGFEGWTQIQFDIAADGKVLAPRAVIAYPPFVFTKAGTGVIGGARYEATYRPNGGLACGGSSNRVRFIMP